MPSRDNHKQLRGDGPEITNSPIPHYEVEYDLKYTGGDYDRVGDFAYVPVHLVDMLGMAEAFRSIVHADPLHIVHWSPDEVFTSDCEPLEE